MSSEARHSSLPPAIAVAVTELPAAIVLDIGLDRDDARRAQLEQDIVLRLELVRPDIVVRFPFDAAAATGSPSSSWERCQRGDCRATALGDPAHVDDKAEAAAAPGPGGCFVETDGPALDDVRLIYRPNQAFSIVPRLNPCLEAAVTAFSRSCAVKANASSWWRSAISLPVARVPKGHIRNRSMSSSNPCRKSRLVGGGVLGAARLLLAMSEDVSRLEHATEVVRQMLRISPNTEREYRRALEAEGLLCGDPNDLPELAALQAALEKHRPTRLVPQQEALVYKGAYKKITSRQDVATVSAGSEIQGGKDTPYSVQPARASRRTQPSVPNRTACLRRSIQTPSPGRCATPSIQAASSSTNP